MTNISLWLNVQDQRYRQQHNVHDSYSSVFIVDFDEYFPVRLQEDELGSLGRTIATMQCLKKIC